MKKKKIFSYEIFCEPLQSSESYFNKAMFGGLAIYYNDLMVLMLTEDPGQKEYKDKTYPFDIWNGILIPTERPYHQQLKSLIPDLIPHPVLGKWLYIPAEFSNFEAIAHQLVDMISNQDPRIGIVPGQSRRKKK